MQVLRARDRRGATYWKQYSGDPKAAAQAWFDELALAHNGRREFVFASVAAGTLTTTAKGRRKLLNPVAVVLPPFPKPPDQAPISYDLPADFTMYNTFESTPTGCLVKGTIKVGPNYDVEGQQGYIVTAESAFTAGPVFFADPFDSDNGVKAGDHGPLFGSFAPGVWTFKAYGRSRWLTEDEAGELGGVYDDLAREPPDPKEPTYRRSPGALVQVVVVVCSAKPPPTDPNLLLLRAIIKATIHVLQVISVAAAVAILVLVFGKAVAALLALRRAYQFVRWGQVARARVEVHSAAQNIGTAAQRARAVADANQTAAIAARYAQPAQQATQQVVRLIGR